MTFKLLKNELGEIRSDLILMIKDGITSCVPNNSANKDWQDYQEWLAQGNEPLAADE